MRSLIILCVVVVLAGCANGANTQVLPPPGAPDASGHALAPARRRDRGRLVLRVHVPRKHHRKWHRHRGAGDRPRYVSAATQSMTVAISGPTNVNQTVNLTPTSSGCSSSLTGTFCTLTISGLAPGNYTGSIGTYDQTGGTGNQLSANQNVSFSITAGQSNTIGITLDGIPTAALLVPGASSTLSGSMSNGYTLSKCGSDAVSVYGVDAGGNIILGAGAPTPSLSSDDTSALSVSTPAPSSPNTFTIVRPSPPPTPGSTVHLTATVTPGADSGASAVSTSAIPMTFNHDICGYITEFSGLSSGADEITAGPDGDLWFTEYGGNRIGKITTGGTVTEYTTGLSSNADPDGITAGPDGNLWFTEYAGNRIGKITTTGTISEYSSGLSSSADPAAITSGPDGNLWFTESNTQKVGKITTSGTITEYSVTGATLPSITSGPDGNLWFLNNSGNGVGKITTSGTSTQYTSGISSGANLQAITSGPDGNLWFAECTGNRIGKITPSGTVTEYSTGLSSGAYPTGITSGPDGNIWFTEQFGNRIGKITPNGTITEYSSGISGGAHPYSITLGSDGSLWFTELFTDNIGRVQ
jgi:streptogramin lyase